MPKYNAVTLLEIANEPHIRCGHNWRSLTEAIDFVETKFPGGYWTVAMYVPWSPATPWASREPVILKGAYDYQHPGLRYGHGRLLTSKPFPKELQPCPAK